MNQKKTQFEILRTRTRPHTPVISIITTVYDRKECLERCIRSVQSLRFTDYEHIIVADCPPRTVQADLARMVAQSDRITLVSLTSRRNDWGISPASAGLSLAKGKYVCFLSDDNGYLPHHFDRLVEALETDYQLGFAYSSCLYNGNRILNTSRPDPGQIDLGQPLFRRELFTRYFGGSLPFREFGWDWRVLERFMLEGTRWKHIDDPTFIFRLAKYV